MNENMVKEVLALFSDEDNHYDTIPQELSRTFGDIETDEEVTYEEPMLAQRLSRLSIEPRANFRLLLLLLTVTINVTINNNFGQ